MTQLKRLLVNRDAGLALLTLLLFAAITIKLPQFAGLQNLRSLVDDTGILVLLALGQMAVILTRGIDLSVAANVALTGMAAALLSNAYPGVPIAAIILASVAFGAALGMLNGALVWQFKIPPIVVTLGTLAIYRGLVYVISGGTWVTSNKMSAEFLGWVRIDVLGLTTLSWLAILGAIAYSLLLRATPTGRRFYAAGSNPVAAAYVGIDVGRAQFVAFTLSGAIGGLCGYLWVARFAVAYTEVAQGFELTVIAACVIGGVSIAGGVGTVTGVLLGCAFLGIVRNALPLLGVSPFWQMAISGAVIVGAVVINARTLIGARQRILEGSSP